MKPSDAKARTPEPTRPRRGSCASTRVASRDAMPPSRPGSPRGRPTNAPWSASSSRSSLDVGSPPILLIRCTPKQRVPRRHRPRRAPLVAHRSAGPVHWPRVCWSRSGWRASPIAADCGRPEPVAMRAALLVAVDAPSNPVVVLPNGVVVDASAVAVLPFAAAGDSTLARGLEREVVAALRKRAGSLRRRRWRRAGIRVQRARRRPRSARSLGLAGLSMPPIVLGDGRVRASARLREAATGATLRQSDVGAFDRRPARRARRARRKQVAAADARLEPARRSWCSTHAIATFAAVVSHSLPAMTFP